MMAKWVAQRGSVLRTTRDGTIKVDAVGQAKYRPVYRVVCDQCGYGEPHWYLVSDW